MKYAIVTGSSGGIGSVIARELSAKGWHIFAIDISLPAIQQVYDNRPDQMSNIEHIVCDMASSESIVRIIKKIQHEVKYIDLLVNCAAYQTIGSIDTLDIKEWDKTMNVNARGPWLLMKASLPLLKRAAELHTTASIVNISSIHALATSHGMFAYAMSKAALSGLTRSASIEFAPYGIRVNTIIPGAVATPMLTEHLNKEEVAKLLSRQLIPELIEPEAIAGIIEFLTSKAARAITGQELIIDSGVLSQLATEMA